MKGKHILLNGFDSPDFVEEQFQKYGVAPRFSFFGNEFDILSPMVERGIGVALISTLALYDLKLSVPMKIWLGYGSSRFRKISPARWVSF